MKNISLSMTKAGAAVLLMALMLTGCGQSDKKTGDNAAAQDSINTEQTQADAEAAAKAEALAKDSAEYTHFTSPDLSSFFLHGRVKTMVETEAGFDLKRTFQFSQDGTLVKYTGYDDEPKGNKIIREKGRISGLGELQYDMMTVSELSYDNNGRCNSYSDITGHGYTTYSYSAYNDNGWPVSAKLSGEFMHMGDESSRAGNITLKYAATDECGNWTKLVKSGSVKTTGTSIDYDPETGEEIENVINETEKISETVVRTITYYTREEVGL